MLLISLSQKYSSNMVGMCVIFGALAESHPIPLPSLHGGEGSSFPVSAPPNDTFYSESVVGPKPGNSGVVISYQVDKLIDT